MAAKGTTRANAYAAFISYAQADKDTAQQVADGLEARGLKCWIAPRDVRPGRSYGDEIIRGIERARCLILVLSSASNGSTFVAREIERAVSKGKPIFPIRVENVQPSPSLEFFISGTQWIDAYEGKLGAHIDRLAGLLGEEEGIQPSPQPVAKPATRLASPLVLGIGAMVAVAAAFGAYWVWGGGGDQSFNYQACLNLDGETALKACNEAIESRKFSGAEAANLYAMRGYQRHVKEDLPGALSDYGDAIRYDPRLVMAYNNRGNIYRDIGDYEKALAYYDQALKLNPDQPDPLASRGWIYAQQGEAERAKKDFRKALALEPADSLENKLKEALARIDGSGSAADLGLFGADSRRALKDFPQDERAKLASAYGYVGTLSKDGQAVCNATLVGRNLVLTSGYCLGDTAPGEVTFSIVDSDGKTIASPLASKITGAPVRGAQAEQRVAVATLAEAVGDEAGWAEQVGGRPAVGDPLDIVAVDLAKDGADARVSGAATGDDDCVVLAVKPDTDTFSHRCISPAGSGGAPIFDAKTKALVGIVGETDAEGAIAYRTDAVPGLIERASAQANR